MFANRRLLTADGTALAYDVHRPPTDDRVPTVVLRTPYGRSKHLEEGRGWAARGYAFVVGDVRGRYDSDGTWEPYRNERADGADLVDWIIAQAWSDGRIIVIGGSYAGYTAWAMAVERPDATAAIVSLGPSMSLARTKFSPSGVLRLGEHAAWWAERADARTSREGLSAIIFREHPTVLDHLPVVEIADRLGVTMPGWTAVIDAGPEARTCEEITASDLAAVRAPSLHVGGWHDLLVDETLGHWELVGDAVTPKRLLVGPWLHDLVFSAGTRVGELDHGEASRIAWATELLTWINDALTGRLPLRRADTFVMGADTWDTADNWPPTSTPDVHDLRPAILHSDPRSPFPSRAEAVDRSPLFARTDAVRWPISTAATRFVGWGSVDLKGRCDTETGDWILRLLLASKSGPAVELAVAEASTETPEVDLRLALGPLSIQVQPGQSLVLELTAADLPRLARNTGSADRYRVGIDDLPHRIIQTVDRGRLSLPAIGDDGGVS
ncbi:CocE/NonD family hydrolase [Plantibacter cousiniae (nom. nud.)]|uniref:CocE/NonD family hydrolase n=1 Tax=Plantibacter cousiniae (nom. nud.) TaxID=199709 RepID=UPI001D839236|nr:CocE/NonD family hydrolase [Plantibacter cousiniae]CAH0242696.1 Cocaine esterase [Plantibacter cousiniae]